MEYTAQLARQGHYESKMSDVENHVQIVLVYREREHINHAERKLKLSIKSYQDIVSNMVGGCDISFCQSFIKNHCWNPQFC